ncbi:MAG: sulfatase-like hydrolase/transferase [SAR324 cluster bacterium]|nr:sulfatase-like hydrolase/transferase [SAR324 cluster bacterium]MBL7035158.1 sulfatase-like hydrolase/transferase [SAR324 cluster bacterium]
MSIFYKIFLYLLIGLSIFLLARLGVISAHYENFSTLTFGDICLAFIYGLRFDLASLLVFSGIPLLLLALPFRWASSLWWHVLLSMLVFFIFVAEGTLLIGDLVYFSFVKRHLTNELLFLANDINYLLKEVTANPIYFAVWLGLIGSASFFWLKLVSIRLQPVRFHWIKFLLLFVLVGVAGRGGVGMKPLAIVHAYSSGNSSFGNLVLNGVFSASHSSLSTPVERLALSEAEIVKTLKLPQDFWQQPFPLTQINIPDSAKQYNLVVLFVESLTPRYLDSFGGNNYKITPNLDKLSTEGWKFNRFYAHGQRSIDGAQSVLTGLPSILGLPAITNLSATYTKIAALAEHNGISTIFVNSTLRESFLARAIAGSSGFGEYYGKEDMPLLLDYLAEERNRDLGWDYETLIFSLEKINKLNTPFLAFISLSTDHTPFPKLQAPFNRFPHHETQEGGYLNSLNYTDWAIGEFFSKAKKENWYKNTIFVITADHVLAHFQSGGFLARFRIPLIFYAPALLKAKEIEIVSSQLDLMPTFVDLMGLKAEYSALGTSLLQKKESMALIKEGSLIGIITDKGFLKHSLLRRMEYGRLADNVTDSYFDEIEARLLAWDRVAYDLTRYNRWAR